MQWIITSLLKLYTWNSLVNIITILPNVVTTHCPGILWLKALSKYYSQTVHTCIPLALSPFHIYHSAYYTINNRGQQCTGAASLKYLYDSQLPMQMSWFMMVIFLCWVEIYQLQITVIWHLHSVYYAVWIRRYKTSLHKLAVSCYV